MADVPGNEAAVELREQLEALGKTHHQLRQAYDALSREKDLLSDVNRNLAEQLLQLQRVEALGRLSGGIAHDFNNLLAIIIGHSDLLVRRLADDETLRFSAREIAKAAELATKLTRKLLDFGRVQPGATGPVDLHDSLNSVRTMLERLIGEDIEMRWHLEAEDSVVRTDPTQFEQVVLNLAVNARDAMPEGGTLDIGTATVDISGDGPDDVRDGRYVRLTVADNGCGMSADVAARAFEPFFTTKANQGTGLGLATVAGIVAGCNGHILLDSDPGAGTTFTIYLPVALPDEPAAAPPADDTGENAGGHETILLVEDESMVREYMANVLQLSGYRIIEAANAHEAILASDEHDGPIDLLLTDVVMPKMNGFELARRLGDSRPDMRLLFISGYYDERVVQRIMKEDAAFLQKPCRIDVLTGKVRAVLDGKS